MRGVFKDDVTTSEGNEYAKGTEVYILELDDLSGCYIARVEGETKLIPKSVLKVYTDRGSM